MVYGDGDLERGRGGDRMRGRMSVTGALRCTVVWPPRPYSMWQTSSPIKRAGPITFPHANRPLRQQYSMAHLVLSQKMDSSADMRGSREQDNTSQYRYRYQYHGLKTSSTYQHKNLETRQTDIKNGLGGFKIPLSLNGPGGKLNNVHTAHAWPPEIPC